MNVTESAGTGSEDGASVAPSFDVSPPANVLLLGSSLDDDEETIQRLLGSVPGQTSLLTVSLLTSPAAQVADWETEWADIAPERVAGIGCEGGMDPAGAQVPRTDLRSTSVSDPGDLTGLGIRISECLDNWTEQSVVCSFDGITPLLQYADAKRVFQFLHVLTTRFTNAGAVTVFHMDPAAHGDREVATIRSLFDAVYERTADGWTPAN